MAQKKLEVLHVLQSCNSISINESHSLSRIFGKRKAHVTDVVVISRFSITWHDLHVFADFEILYDLAP